MSNASDCPNKEATCGNCKNAKVGAMNIVFCEPLDSLIPHEFDGERYIFWRIPTFCPRESTEVVKSDETAPKDKWVFKLKDEVPKLP